MTYLPILENQTAGAGKPYRHHAERPARPFTILFFLFSNLYSTTEARFSAVDTYARAQGFLSGFPNFHQANYGRVYGTLLIKPGYAERRDVPLSQLMFR